jgi:hypothetical protein
MHKSISSHFSYLHPMDGESFLTISMAFGKACGHSTRVRLAGGLHFSTIYFTF